MKSEWRKSSRSGNAGGNCVEIRADDHGFQVRDSKLGDGSPIFDMSTEEFVALMRAAQR